MMMMMMMMMMKDDDDDDDDVMMMMMMMMAQSVLIPDYTRICREVERGRKMDFQCMYFKYRVYIC